MTRSAVRFRPSAPARRYAPVRPFCYTANGSLYDSASYARIEPKRYTFTQTYEIAKVSIIRTAKMHPLSFDIPR